MATTPAEFCLTAATCLPSSEWAAWVQAVGSVVAILVAIAVPAFQHGLERRSARRQKMFEVVRSISISILMLEHVRDMIQAVKSKLSEGESLTGPGVRQMLSRHLEEDVNAMRNLSLHGHMQSSKSACMWLACITLLDGIVDIYKMEHLPVDKAIDGAISALAETLAHLQSEHSTAKRAAAK